MYVGWQLLLQVGMEADVVAGMDKVGLSRANPLYCLQGFGERLVGGMRLRAEGFEYEDVNSLQGLIGGVGAGERVRGVAQPA